MIQWLRQANSLLLQTCKDRPGISLNMDINKILISSNKTQENKKKWITKKLHNIILSLVIMTDDKKRVRPAGGMRREHDSFETQQSNRRMWRNRSQRINIVYIKVDSSIRTNSIHHNFTWKSGINFPLGEILETFSAYWINCCHNISLLLKTHITN